MMNGNSWHAGRIRALGFSLVELMITLVLAAFLISALILTFLSGRVAATDAGQLSRMQENVRIISEYLVRDIRNAGYIDEVETLFGQDDLMREEFAEIVGNNMLRVRYAGRGHCGEQFNQFVLVENEYFVNDGILFCRGRHVPGATIITTGATWDSVLVSPSPDPGPVELISGISAVRFSRLNPVGQTNCQFNYSLSPDPGTGNVPLVTSCIGVQVDVDLVGVRGDIRRLSLVSGFRNVILERVANGVPAP
jgi:hypothetical protein